MTFTSFTRLLAAAVLALLPLSAAQAQTTTDQSSPTGQNTGANGAPPPPTLEDLPPAAAGTAECAWVGQRILMLLWRDDIDTANRFFNAYERFGCPAAHSGLAFRCLVQLGEGEGEGDPGLPERARACWDNPALDPATLTPPPGEQQPAEGEQPAEGGQQKTD